MFEYITGGGFAGQALPPSLAAEGRMMLQALLDDLKPLTDVRLLLPLDERCSGLALPEHSEVVTIGEAQDVLGLLPGLISRCDAFWPIAPESDGLLADLAELAVAQGKRLLLSSPQAVRLCGDKLATYRALSAHGIAAVETRPLPAWRETNWGRSVVKPADGVGCLGAVVFDDALSLQCFIEALDRVERYVIQPFCEGEAISLSCLFKDGQAWLLCCNQQQVEMADGHFVLKGCRVNTDNPRRAFYQNLITKIALAVPGLWGYVGIDLIETPARGPLILEINPRLTTSYVGIGRATGIRLAERLLMPLDSEWVFPSTQEQAIDIAIY